MLSGDSITNHHKLGGFKMQVFFFLALDLECPSCVEHLLPRTAMFRGGPLRADWIVKAALMPLILLQSLMGQPEMGKGENLWGDDLEGLFCP